MRAAWGCLQSGMNADKAGLRIAEMMTRPPNSPREIEQAIEKVYNTPSQGMVKNYHRPVRATYKPDNLISLTQKMDGFSAADLAARSPICPEYVTPAGFLRHLYRKDEKIILFTTFQSQGQDVAEWSDQEDEPGAFDGYIRAKEGKGAWFLANPVDGGFREFDRLKSANNLTGRSRRCEECITNFRYLVMESDEVDPAIWIAAMVQIPLPIVSVTSSGGKSLHALVRVDADSADHWRGIKAKIAPALVTLGADNSAMTAVRLTRLPQCFRAEKERWQELLYLNPAADETPIAQLPTR